MHREEMPIAQKRRSQAPRAIQEESDYQAPCRRRDAYQGHPAGSRPRAIQEEPDHQGQGERLH